MKYFVIETQTRTDGEVNIITTSKNSFASGLSFWHERCSKMVLTELYLSVSVMLVDENLREYKNETLETQYKPIEVKREEAKEEAEDEAETEETVIETE